MAEQDPQHLTGNEAELAHAAAVRIAEASLRMARWLHRAEIGLPIAGMLVPVLELVVESGGMRPSEIAERTGMDRPAIARSVSRLVQYRAVERRRLSGDRRQLLITATDRGEELLAEIRTYWQTMMEAALGNLPASERRQLIRVLPVLDHLSGPLPNLPRQTGVSPWRYVSR